VTDTVTSTDTVTRLARAAGPADDAAITELYRRHYAGLVRLAVLLLDDVGSAEDVVQESYAELYRRWDRLRDTGRALVYLRAAVLNRSRSALRRRRIARRYTPPVERPAGSPEQAAVLREDQLEVGRALMALPVRMREVLVLRYYLDLPFAEIATTLGIGESSARAYASRGIAALSQKLKDPT
jgi:RNA polymerase sigma-70 factor (sigma-E family)